MDRLWKKVSKMDLGNPVITALVGLVIFYIGLKNFFRRDEINGKHGTSSLVYR